MEDTIARVVHNLIGRLDGPLHFRIILQPIMAIVFAARDGIRDEQNGEPAYFWSLFTEPHLRSARLRNGWKSIARIFLLAVVLDSLYQLIVLHWFYPFETLIVAIILALLPYALLRGPVNRFMRTFSRPRRKNVISSANTSGTSSKPGRF